MGERWPIRCYSYGVDGYTGGGHEYHLGDNGWAMVQFFVRSTRNT